ncbi:hypothetical protein V1519DRAFT_455865 [Lipomyces tetrasporus]
MRALALRVDSRHMERQMEKGRPNSFISQTYLPTADPAEPEPMQLDLAKLGNQDRIDKQERDRRLRLGLCFICAERGHLSAACPKKPKNDYAQ